MAPDSQSNLLAKAKRPDDAPPGIIFKSPFHSIFFVNLAIKRISWHLCNSSVIVSLFFLSTAMAWQRQAGLYRHDSLLSVAVSTGPTLLRLELTDWIGEFEARFGVLPWASYRSGDGRRIPVLVGQGQRMRRFRAASLIVARLFDEIARNSAANSYKRSLARQSPLAVPFDGLISP